MRSRCPDGVPRREFTEVEPLSEEELFPFREPIGYRKAHLSLHSEVATIPLSLAHKGSGCEFKIHFFGFSEGRCASWPSWPPWPGLHRTPHRRGVPGWCRGGCW